MDNDETTKRPTSPTTPEEQLDRGKKPASPLSTVAEAEKQEGSKGKGLAFWLVFVSLCVTSLLSALELTSVSTALPTIVHDLNGDDFVWIGSAYSLAATAFLPTFGGLAAIWGRKPVMVVVLSIFIAGSAICGAAQNMNMLIAGRTLQGMGSGGILSMTEIIVADLVPLRERGVYIGIMGSVWAFASAIGPPVGGALAGIGQWRWLFYLNLPLGAVAMVLVLVYLNFRVPRTSWREKLSQMDWIGNILIIGSTTSCTIALTWAGVTAPWSSARILVPLLIGLVGLAASVLYEARYASHPIVPYNLLSTRTGFAGHMLTFIHGFVTMALVYYLPVFLQASRGASPVKSSIYIFGSTFSIAPAGMVAGVSVAVSNRYRPQTFIAWIFMILGFGLLTTLSVTTSMGIMEGYQIILGVGIGVLYTVTSFPVLASVRVNQVAPALALYTFDRSFAYTWGITIGGTILQNELKKRLPSDFVALLPQGVNIAYATIPVVASLPEPLREQVRVAFATSASTIWKIMAGISGAGLLVTLVMKELPMHVETDENWDFEEKVKQEEEEAVEKEKSTEASSQ